MYDVKLFLHSLHQCFLPLGGIPELYRATINEMMNSIWMKGGNETHEQKRYTHTDKS